ncbi:hypothetical protein [Serratia fonticola]
MKEENALERFKHDTRNHSMSVENDNGVFRHLHFSRSNSSFYHFTLTTWPGHLCIGGDMGTYVFRRVHDMFNFFRMDHRCYQHGDDPVINTGYWAEKLQTGGGHRREVYTEWSSDAFEAQVQELHDQWLDDFDPDDYEGDAETVKARVKEEIDELKSNGEDEWSAVAALRDFYCEHISMDDFWESGNCRITSFHYLWCLYAIVWGIQLYDRRNLVNSAMDKFFVYQLIQEQKA